MHGALIALLDDTKVLVDIMCEIKTLAFGGWRVISLNGRLSIVVVEEGTKIVYLPGRHLKFRSNKAMKIRISQSNHSDKNLLEKTSLVLAATGLNDLLNLRQSAGFLCMICFLGVLTGCGIRAYC
jgi:hypothetical protein